MLLGQLFRDITHLLKLSFISALFYRAIHIRDRYIEMDL